MVQYKLGTQKRYCKVRGHLACHTSNEVIWHLGHTCRASGTCMCQLYIAAGLPCSDVWHERTMPVLTLQPLPTRREKARHTYNRAYPSSYT